MKTTFKALVLAASLSMIAGSAFAIDLDLVNFTLAPLADFDTAATAVQTEIAAGGLFDAAADVADSVAVIVQFGTNDINFAFIDQAGTNNVAAIVQDSTTNANSAAIQQLGLGNRAFITQH